MRIATHPPASNVRTTPDQELHARVFQSPYRSKIEQPLAIRTG